MCDAPAPRPPATLRCDVILPAGGPPPPNTDRVGAKALLEVAGQTLLYRAISAVAQSAAAARVAVIGPPEVLTAATGAGVTCTVPDAGSGPANIYAGLEALSRHDDAAAHVLIVTTDLPALEPEHVDAFIEDADPNADLVAPLVERRRFDAVFPGSPATSVRLREGHVTTGCMFLCRVDALTRVRPLLQRAFDRRKSPLALARIAGPAFVASWLTGTLSVRAVVRRAERVTGCTVGVVPGAHPATAYDVDTEAELRYIRRHFEEGRA